MRCFSQNLYMAFLAPSKLNGTLPFDALYGQNRAHTCLGQSKAELSLSIKSLTTKQPISADLG